MTAKANAKATGMGALLAWAAVAAAGQAAAAGMDLSGTIEASGAKPAWTLTISDTRFTLARPGKPAVQAAAPGAMITPAGASWAAKAADGRAMQVTLQNRACTLAGRQYPMAAQVAFAGETLSGCAGAAR